MEEQGRRLPSLAAVAAGCALITGSFLPWETGFEPGFGSTTHSGLECYCGGGLTLALGVILMILGSAYLSDRHPWLPPFAGAIAWLPTIALSVIAGGAVALLWTDVLDDVRSLLAEGDSGTGAIGIGVYVMTAGAGIGLVGGILMRARRPKRGRET